MVFALLHNVRALMCVYAVRRGGFVLACAFAGVLSAATTHGNGPSPRPAPPAYRAYGPPTSVFFIQRNKNRNEVHYRLDVDEDCLPAGKSPLSPYWRRLEEGPDVVKPITLLQRRAYGIERQSVGDAGVTAVLRALPARAIEVESRLGERGCEAAAFMNIDGRRTRFERAYVFATEGLLLPKVEYIDLFGRDVGGALLSERIEPE